MRKIELLELRRIQIEILDDIHRFCEQRWLSYSLCGGTLLGAVRHRGYIPWDDDIDLMMPRSDYERFAREYRSEDNELVDLRTRPDCVEFFLKVCRKGTRMTDIALGRSLWGVNVDIFPVDGAPADYEDHCKRILKKRQTLAWICPFYKEATRNKWFWAMKYIAKKIIRPSPYTVLELKQEIDGEAAGCDMDSCEHAGVILGSYGVNEVVPASIFKEYAQLQFEGKQYWAITGYDTYLSAIYGDYMVLPPEDQRVTHHLYDAYTEE